MFGTQKWPLGHFEVARGLARSRIALWELLWGRKRFFYWLLGVKRYVTLTSPIVINEAKRSALVLETEDFFCFTRNTYEKQKQS